MVAPVLKIQASGSAQCHFRNRFGNQKPGGGGADDVGDRDARGPLAEDEAFRRRLDDRHVGDHQVHRSNRREGERAFLDDLGRTLGAYGSWPRSRVWHR